MTMRAVVVVGIVALLCGVADAAPKKPAKKRKGTFAAYIDPAAPDDPPMPAPPLSTRAQQQASEPEALSVVLLIDRSISTDGDKLDVAKAAALHVQTSLDDDDQVAVLAFDTAVEKVQRAVYADNITKVSKAIRSVKAQGGTDLTAALLEARSYLDGAPGLKLIVLFTDAQRADDRLPDAINALRADNIGLVVAGMPRADRNTLYQMADMADGLVFMLDQYRALDRLADFVAALHDR